MTLVASEVDHNLLRCKQSSFCTTTGKKNHCRESFRYLTKEPLI